VTKDLDDKDVQKMPPKELGALERFFDTTWNDFVKRFRWFIIIFGFALAGYAAQRSTEIMGLSAMEAYFFPSHFLAIATEKVLTGFNENEMTSQTIVVDVMWGLEGISKEGVDYYNASDIGTVIWDDDFDVALAENQQEIYDFCQSLKNESHLLYEGKGTSLSCWIDDFKDFLEEDRQRFPVQAILYRNQSENFYYLLERFINETQAGADHVFYQNLQFIDSRLVFMRFRAKSAGSPFDPHSVKKPLWEGWDRVLEQFNEKASPGVNKALQTAGLDWCFAIMEIRLVETMRTGLKLSIGFALFALLVATLNIIQAVLASLTIGLIIVNVMAIVAYMKWELGSGESVGVVVCVGFAVDYVVHLASHYVHSQHKDRDNRMKESLRELGGSILSGSITTVGATCTLFLAVLTLFHKFGIFVISTIIFSIFYSLGFFAALCHVCGPIDKFGNIIHMYQTTKSFSLGIYLKVKSKWDAWSKKFNAHHA
jgi:hypothetical protein